jgi:hypothetical protein
MRKYRTKSSGNHDNRNDRDYRRSLVYAAGLVPTGGVRWPYLGTERFLVSASARGVRIPRSFRYLLEVKNG